MYLIYANEVSWLLNWITKHNDALAPSKISCSRNWALPFTGVYKKPTPLPHDHRSSNFPCDASAAQTIDGWPRKSGWQKSNLCALTRTVWGCTVMLPQLTTDHLFWPLKQQLGGHLLHNNEEVHMDAHECLWMQQPKFYNNAIFKFMSEWGISSTCLDIMLKIKAHQWPKLPILNTVTSHLKRHS